MVCAAQLQLGVQGILVLDARENGPAASAGVHGTKRDPSSGRLMLGDIITGFNATRVRCVPRRILPDARHGMLFAGTLRGLWRLSCACSHTSLCLHAECAPLAGRAELPGGVASSGRLSGWALTDPVHGRLCRNSSDLFKALDRCAIGDTVDLEVLRDNDKQHLTITLGSST